MTIAGETPEKRRRDLARRIAVTLFTEGGTDRLAKRLVMEHTGGKLGAGWSLGPMTDVIEDILVRYTPRSAAKPGASRAANRRGHDEEA